MNYFDTKSEEAFKVHIDNIKEKILGKKDYEILVSQNNNHGTTHYFAKLNSDKIDPDISLDELADSGIFLDTSEYYVYHDYKDRPSTGWQKNNGKLFISLDALLRTKENSTHATAIGVNKDYSANLEIMSLKKPYK
jgi:hypothetical protein